MPKHRRTTKLFRKPESVKSNRDILQRQLSCVQRDKENKLNSITAASNNDSIINFMKIEVKQEQLDNDQEINEEIQLPLKIEQFDYNSIKHEASPERNRFLSGTNTELNILIEWALNLQFDHSKKCKGRLYPSKEIFDNFTCKIVVLYCTVCKKRMLHTLKDWAMF